ncbi:MULTISPECIES: GNAT family N-acetyltransferase [unclassified Tenacibaculum]|uniref:GNAT family N-acetyltransferase n=1 Tax=unclassified Tenacibaculum TaxID=2635139 RepID=UPI001F1611A4|nr:MULTISPECIES: GNAT family N-acetyltransferase [unclassified Tenacibaculum]MCF2875809.1 GNAT family N-acetyltransferase [Tenacibaculum sp. Cn5-1]MCF2935884.1 GNAT family N-acetyltransferase [Tenacibaculum sp. Cn5-34]MCG7512445.1 GNAT family N-acetyltransferase [Tenacibaculum sp. Cn5-46]
MKFITRPTLSTTEKLEIFELWNNEYPEKLSYATIDEFDQYLQNLLDQSHILLVDQNEKIRGWYFDFERDNERWFAIILDSSVHGHGFGTKILDLAKQKEKELNGWVIDHNLDKKKNGDLYNSPLNFYLKNGFKKLAENRLELEKISAVQIKWSRIN